MSVGNVAASGAAHPDIARIGTNIIEWSPDDGGTATITSREPIDSTISKGVMLGGLGGGLGLIGVGLRKSSIARAAAQEAGLGAAEVFRAGRSARGAWSLAGAGLMLAALGGLAVTQDYLMPTTTTQQPLTREEFETAAQHETMPNSLALGAAVAGFGTGAVGATAVTKALSSAPSPVRFGAGMATMLGLSLGTMFGVQELYNAAT